MSEAVVRQNNDLRGMIKSDAYKKQWAMVLPKHLTPDRMARVALTAVTKTPKLLSCTQESVMACLLDCAAMGIEPDGRRAHLIPYGSKCTLIVDYKGIAELVMRSGVVSHIHASLVCENDEFDENMGRVITHRINRRDVRGDIYAVYSHVVMKDGTESFEVMSKDEVDAIRARSKTGNNGPWVTDYGEMAKKTVFKRHSKWLPLSPEIRDAVDTGNDIIDINNRVEVGKPVVDIPAIADATVVAKPDLEPTPEPPKRRRRSKAEMAEAKRIAEEANKPAVVDMTEDAIPESVAEPPEQEPVDDKPAGGPFAAPIVKPEGEDNVPM